MSPDFDLAIVGAGFSGSLLALIARRLGRRVILVERGHHPRFAIGESSTPVANLLLEELARRYDLPQLLPLTKWGPWQRAHPGIACGLKRGFTFFGHSPDRAWTPGPARSHQLLVAASPHDEISDTHWYRPDFDAFLAAEAVRCGVEYSDHTELDAPRPEAGRVGFTGHREGSPVRFTARFVVDATGPRGFLHQALGLGEVAWPDYPALQAVFSHFTGVRRWADLHPSPTPPPYPPDDAALHHVGPDGWMWVLRFNNGITSAGFTGPRAPESAKKSSPKDAWEAWLRRYPSVAEQFAQAEPTREFTRLPGLSFRSRRATGPWWLQLPSAAGFVDPLLSTGFPLTLLGIERVAHLLEDDWPAAGLAAYEEETFGDLDLTAAMVAALYRVMPDFATFCELTMGYFAAAIFTETARRLGHPERAPGFLLRHHPQFGPGLRRVLERAGRVPGSQLMHEIHALVEPFNLGGLCRPEKEHWYACDASDLYAAAGRIGATEAELRAMLARCGFDACQSG